MTVTQNVSLDMDRPIYQVAYSKVGDTERVIEATLYFKGAEWDIPSGATLQVRSTDQGGNVHTSSETSFEDNVATVTLPMYTIQGNTPTEIVISVGGEEVATFDFNVAVYPSAASIPTPSLSLSRDTLETPTLEIPDRPILEPIGVKEIEPIDLEIREKDLEEIEEELPEEEVEEEVTEEEPIEEVAEEVEE